MSHHATHQKTPTGLALTRHGALDSGWLAKFRGHQYSRHRVRNPHARSAHGFPSSGEPGGLHILLAAGKSLGGGKLWRRGGVVQPPDERVLNRTREKAHSNQPEHFLVCFSETPTKPCRSQSSGSEGQFR